VLEKPDHAWDESLRQALLLLSGMPNETEPCGAETEGEEGGAQDPRGRLNPNPWGLASRTGQKKTPAAETNPNLRGGILAAVFILKLETPARVVRTGGDAYFRIVVVSRESPTDILDGFPSVDAALSFCREQGHCVANGAGLLV